jgi:hypothetical protein
MCPWCGQAFESGALERIAIAGEQAFKRNAYAIFFSAFLGSLGGAALFSTSNLKTNGTTLSFREQSVKPRTLNQKVDQAKRWVQFTAR